MLEEIFSKSEICEVKTFLVAYEYGIALDVTVDIIIDEKKKPRREVISLINDLVIEMDLDPATYAEKLDMR